MCGHMESIAENGIEQKAQRKGHRAALRLGQRAAPHSRRKLFCALRVLFCPQFTGMLSRLCQWRHFLCFWEVGTEAGEYACPKKSAFVPPSKLSELLLKKDSTVCKA